MCHRYLRMVGLILQLASQLTECSKNLIGEAATRLLPVASPFEWPWLQPCIFCSFGTTRASTHIGVRCGLGLWMCARWTDMIGMTSPIRNRLLGPPMLNTCSHKHR